jgi:hypothetical protein
MPHRASHSRPLPRAAAVIALLASCISLVGCADMSDSMSTAFADPAKYDLYECKQLEVERKNLAARSADLQKLMAKAETGVAGSVVAELAYRNDYIAVRGQSRLAEEAWERSKCHASAPVAAGAPAAGAAAAAPAAPPVNVKRAKSPSRSDNSIY